MKLVIQIPCFNEEKTLGSVLAEIPKKIEGIEKIEVQIIDDGSTDKTVEVAKKYQVTRVISHLGNKGLGISFSDGMEVALKNGADILVNTDGDNQYPGKYIPNLIRPILDNRAEIVIANRQTDRIEYFSWSKRFFQMVGSWVVRFLSGTDVPDAVSGFRAYSKSAMLELNTVTKFSYCIDTIIQAGKKGLKVVSIPITVNGPTRESRLSRNMWQHIKRSTADLLRVFVMYEPLKTFSIMAMALFLPAIIFLGRFIYFYFLKTEEAGGHIQSLVIATGFLTGSIQLFALGVLADLISINRKLTGRVLKMKKQENGK